MIFASVLPAADALTSRNPVTRPSLFLGIESSCDDTAAAVVCGDPASGKPGEILSSVIFGQNDLHAPFGGVVPEIAARAHAERLDICIRQTLSQAQTDLNQISAIAVTAGPGLIGGVLAGVSTARAIASAKGLPLYGINHLAGHALTPRLTDGIAFPYLMLLVSGGHCQFLRVNSPTSFQRLGASIDDAPGEAFDKIAKLLGLGYPGGPEVEREAKSGDPERYKFPRPLLDVPGCDMSFSGLKTAVRRQIDLLGNTITTQIRADICASFQAATADVFAEKSRRAMLEMGAVRTPVIAVAGGVAANQTIRKSLQDISDAAGFTFLAPPLPLCTDNAAMIAWVGIEHSALGIPGNLTFSARPRWPLDQTSAPVLGSGRKGAKA